MIKELPTQAQMSPVYAVSINDFNEDGIPDIVLGGNLFGVKPEVGRYDASFGVLLTGNGDGSFTESPSTISGLHMDGEVRDMVTIKSGNKNQLLVVRNGNSILSYTYDN